jgi:hypothetical protein
MEIIDWSSTHEIPKQNHEIWGDSRLGLLRDGLKMTLQKKKNVPQYCYLTWNSRSIIVERHVTSKKNSTM